MIINTFYKTDSIIDGFKYSPPSEIINYGYVIALEWTNEDGKRHNDNGPAYIEYDKNGNVQYKSWYINGKRHNENSPSHISYYEKGNVKYKEWYINGKEHNENGPAVIVYDQNGKRIL